MEKAAPALEIRLMLALALALAAPTVAAQAYPVRPIRLVAATSAGGITDHLARTAAAGLGGSWVDVGTSSDTLSDFDAEDGPFLTWQARAGLGWKLGSRTALGMYPATRSDSVCPPASHGVARAVVWSVTSSSRPFSFSPPLPYS